MVDSFGRAVILPAMRLARFEAVFFAAGLDEVFFVILVAARVDLAAVRFAADFFVAFLAMLAGVFLAAFVLAAIFAPYWPRCAIANGSRAVEPDR